MLASTLLTLAGAALALASPDGGYGGGGGTDIVKNADLKKSEKALKISLKELCYRNLYADVARHKLKYNKEVLVQDDKGKDVFLFDGIKKDVNDKEFYYEEFCYKQFNFKQHDADVKKQNTAVIDAGKGGGGHYKRGFNDQDGLFSLDSWGEGFGGLGGGYGGIDGGLLLGKGGYGGFGGDKGGFESGYGDGYGRGEGFDSGYGGYGRGKGFDSGYGGGYGRGDGFDSGYGSYGRGKGFDSGYGGGKGGFYKKARA